MSCQIRVGAGGVGSRCPNTRSTRNQPLQTAMQIGQVVVVAVNQMDVQVRHGQPDMSRS